jgi:hypothetical protein
MLVKCNFMIYKLSKYNFTILFFFAFRVSNLKLSCPNLNKLLMDHKKYLFIIPFIMFNGLILFGQSKPVNRDKYQIHIVQTDKSIDIDGILDEEPWTTAECIGKFTRVTPIDTGFATAQTDVMLTYDKSNLYLGIICYDPTPGKRPVESLRRDFTFERNDNFEIFMDTYNDQTNGYTFGVSAAGAQTEGLQSDGARALYSWDAKWKSSVKNYDDRWVAEFSIPFRNLRYFEQDKEWGINFGRLDLKTNEKSTWAPVPRQFPHRSLAYTGTLMWDKPFNKAGLRFSLIPYITAKATKDNLTRESVKLDGNAGFDAKVILSSSLNLDLTINPDYSQVEVDRQVTNLDRFELSFPERRQFFLENSDLFSNLGETGLQPFFSRRIGLDIPVIGGGRLSGQIGNNWRIGLMNMQTGSKDDTPSSNFAVAVLQRQVFSRSNIVGFLINKQVTSDYNDTLYSGYRYNRVAGLEYNLASQDNKWKGKAFYHQAFYPGATSNSAAVAGNIAYSTKYFTVNNNMSWIGSYYVAEVGYIRRTGYFEASPGLKYTFYPTNSKILSHGPNLNFDIILDPDLEMTDRKTQFGYTIGWHNMNSLTFSVDEQFVKLDRSFDPTNTGGIKLAAGTGYDWQSANVSFSSDARRMFFFTLGSGFGTYYKGNRSTISGSVNYRVQPYGSIAITANYNNISMPDPYNSAKLILIGPSLDITFTDKLFLTTFIQYNDQIDNINTNIRFQWRYAPASDLFIIYTDNSYAGDFANKNRGLVIKMSYWFN